MGPLLELRDVAVTFRAYRGLLGLATGRGAAFHAVDGVSLAAAEGEVLGVVGESGSGKTTLGKAVVRLHRPSAGRVILAGQDITDLGAAGLRPIRKQCQMIFQDPMTSLNPRHTVRRIIGIPLALHGGQAGRAAEPRIDEILALVGLGPTFKERYPHELSGGQRQRVAIARVLAVGPRLVVADEPVSKLDVSVRAQILNLFRELQERLRLTLVFITHDLRVARYLCDRIAVMYYGKLVEIGPAEALFAGPAHPYTRALLDAVPSRTPADRDRPRRVGVVGEPPNPLAPPAGCRFVRACPYREAVCESAPPAPQAVGLGHEVSCHFGERFVGTR